MVQLASRHDTSLNQPSPALPRVGMLARLRNRLGLVAAVTPFDSRTTEGILHLVRVEYTAGDGSPEDTVIWEREHGASLVEPTLLPQVSEQEPMPDADFDALVWGARWSALAPLLSPDGTGGIASVPIASPLFGAVQVEDFQLEPLLRALQMPRVSLLLADDVGLGKTIEAGLILSELIIRRRIRRVLILCPAALRYQWQQEMRDKFSLSFDQIDRAETHALQKRLGLDVNPFRTYQRIITSYHYLRQPDVLEQFVSICRNQTKDSYELPWDLLIVDEAHNLMPSNFGDDSELSKMLRIISPWFEHKLFLTATPHNGHTRCFSGLLEQLDPVRFTQVPDFSAAERQRIEQTVVRRLKSEINQLDADHKRPRRFAERFLDPQPLFFGKGERALHAAFQAFRQAVKAEITSRRNTERTAGAFAIEVLNKRLLSCPHTFAESWFRLKQGLLAQTEATAHDVDLARRSTEEDIEDDLEREGRARHAVRTVGAWLRPLADVLARPIQQVDEAVAKLGLHAPEDADNPSLGRPKEDARFDRLLDLLRKKIRRGDQWASDERIIIFTEYKTTLDYLEQRLRESFKDQGQAVRVLFGGGHGLSDKKADRENIKQAFNNAADPVRVLVATDAASEGLNLQESARYLLHYEIPWNPSRLEQRNGRLDRHGQARDVSIFHFTSEEDADLKFLGHVVKKVHAIREDLGSMGEVFDAAFQRRFDDEEDCDRVAQTLDLEVEARKGRAALPRRPMGDESSQAFERLQSLRRDIDLSPVNLQRSLEVALGLRMGHPRMTGPDSHGRMQLNAPLPHLWKSLIDDCLRLPLNSAQPGALPHLIFDPQHFVETTNGRPVFRPAQDTVLLHLGHPIFQKALATFARARFPGAKDELDISRWTVRMVPRTELPPNADALLLLTVEELAVNELREAIHHWVRTLRFPIQGGELQPALPYLAPAADHCVPGEPGRLLASREAVGAAQSIWIEVERDVPQHLRAHAKSISAQMQKLLREQSSVSLREERERFRNRLKEVERAMSETSIERLRKERDRLVEEMRQGELFAIDNRAQRADLLDLEAELSRRTSHYKDLIELLEKEQARVLEHILPRRYTLHGHVQVFPVAIEIRLPEARS